MRFYKENFSLEPKIHYINILSLNIRLVGMTGKAKKDLMNPKNAYI